MLIWLPLWGCCSGLLLLFVAERTLGGPLRLVLDGLAALALVTGLVAAVLRRHRAQDPARRQAATWALTGYLQVVAGVLLYAATTSDVGLIVSPGAHTLATVAFPALIALGLVPTTVLERFWAVARYSPVLELSRLRMARQGTLAVVLGAISFAGINYTAQVWNRKVDLSYFKTTQAGSGTLSLLQQLPEPVQVVLFFPPGNDVLEAVRHYFDGLTPHSNKLRVEMTDQALEPGRARALQVAQNGSIALTYGDKTEVFKLPLDAEDARHPLRRLDSEIYQRLMRVTKPNRVAYFTAGHGERDWMSAPGGRAGIRDLKLVCEMLGFTVKRLSLGEGLGSKIPDDAALVAVVGAEQPLAPMEADALTVYFKGGGRLLVAADVVTSDDRRQAPEPQGTAQLLAALGLRLSRQYVAHDDERYRVRVSGQRPSPYDLVTNRFVSHPSLATFNQDPGRLAMVLLHTGHLEKVAQQDSLNRVQFTVNTMPGAWEDKDGNGTFESQAEQRSALAVAAAIERVSAAPTQEANAPSAAPTAPPPGRAVVVATSDVVADSTLRQVAGNLFFVQDSLRWLGGDDGVVGEVESEEDVRIMHRKDADAIWFYGTSVFVPLFTLALGLWLSRSRALKASEPHVQAP